MGLKASSLGFRRTSRLLLEKVAELLMCKPCTNMSTSSVSAPRYCTCVQGWGLEARGWWAGKQERWLWGKVAEGLNWQLIGPPSRKNGCHPPGMWPICVNRPQRLNKLSFLFVLPLTNVSTSSVSAPRYCTCVWGWGLKTRGWWGGKQERWLWGKVAEGLNWQLIGPPSRKNGRPSPGIWLICVNRPQRLKQRSFLLFWPHANMSTSALSALRYCTCVWG